MVFALEAHNAAALNSEVGASLKPVASAGLFTDDRQRQRQLMLDNLIERSTYQVWSNQRTLLLEQIRQHYREAAIASPLDASVWFQLTALEAELKDGDENYAFALSQALSTGAWHNANFYFLAMHCLDAKALLNATTGEQCTALLDVTPAQIKASLGLAKVAIDPRHRQRITAAAGSQF